MRKTSPMATKDQIVNGHTGLRNPILFDLLFLSCSFIYSLIAPLKYGAIISPGNHRLILNENSILLGKMGAEPCCDLLN
jgi:hypothetical protein